MRRIFLVVATLGAALALAGCSAGGDSTDEIAGGGTAAEPPAGQPAEGDAGVDGARGDAPADAAESPRDIVTTGSVSITVDDPIDAADDAVALVLDAGGRVDGRSERAATETSTASATLTLRIPAAELDGVLADLRELGRADDVTLQASDVTVQRQDVDARISSLRASITRLEGLIASPTTTLTDLLALETAITDRRAELESLEAQQRGLTDMIAMSTIQLDLRTEAEAPTTRPDTFVDGVAAGWGALVGFGSTLLVALGVLLPWLALAGIITGAVIALVRGLRGRARRGTDRAAGPDGGTATPGSPTDPSSGGGPVEPPPPAEPGPDREPTPDREPEPARS